jgi:hypothetical protein
MNIWSLIFGIIGCVCFALDAFSGLRRVDRSTPGAYWYGSLVPLGLLFFLLAFMFQLLVTTTDPITF